MKKNVFVLLLCLCMVFSVSMTVGCTNPPPPTYEITFELGEGSADMGEITAQREGTNITLPNATPERIGHDFSGWVYNNTVYQAGDSFTMPAQNVTFVAQYTKKSYIVKFDGVEQTVLWSETATPPLDSTPTDNAEWDYTFDGWVLDANSNGQIDDGESVVGEFVITSNVDFITKYSQTKQTYSIKFDGVEQVLSYGDTIVAPADSTPQDDEYWDYTFTGWKNLATGLIETEFGTVVGNVEYETSYTREKVLYYATFDSDNGEGDSPIVEGVGKGELFTFPQNTYTKHGYTFAGWLYSGNVYQAGQTIEMPATTISIKAQWEVFNPTFSQASYSYDKVVAGELELPLNLGGLNPYYLDFNGEYLDSSDFRYDSDTECLVVSHSYMISLNVGTYTVTLLTDGDGEPAVCSVVVENSIVTEFDSVTTKEFVYGIDQGVSFDVNFGEATITAVKQGDLVIDGKYYTLEENKFTIKDEWLRKYYSDTTYSIYLSNYDKYDFTIQTNVVFYTDYDVTTIHDTYVSNVGHNSLYQYSDNVTIVDQVDGMSGKVLKFTPNTTDVLYDCHSIYTIGTSTCPYNNWYKGGLLANKGYVISFDYMTVDTTVGEFKVTSAGGSWNVPLDLGNNNVVKSFSVFVNGSDFVNGVSVWAKFIGGSGYIYFDNFSISEYDAIPTIQVNNDVEIGADDLIVSYDAQGFDFTITIDGQEVAYDANSEQGKIIVSASELESLSAGKHSIEFVTNIASVSASFNVTEASVSEFDDLEMEYSYENGGQMKLMGSFDENVTIASIKQIDKAYDNGYGGGWDLSHCDASLDYKDMARLVTGLDGTGYVEFDNEFGTLFWGETQFVVKFSTGKEETITLKITDVPFFTNYTDSSNIGYLNGNLTPHVLNNSGLNRGTYGVENGQYVVRSTYNAQGQASAEPSLFTTKFTNQVSYDFFRVLGSSDKLFKIEVVYTVSNLAQDSVYLEVWGQKGTNFEDKFFGDYDYVATGAALQDCAVYSFTCDGQEHVISTGWFAYDEVRGGCRIRMPQFNSDANAYLAINSIRIVTRDVFASPLANVNGEYSEDDVVSFSCLDEITSATLNGETLSLEKTENEYSFSVKNIGTNVLVIKTAKGTFRKTFNVSANSVAVLTETSKTVTYGAGDIKLAGEFDTSITVTSVKRLGTNDWDNTTPGCNAVIKDGSMKTSYVTVEEDGLVISKELVDQCYGTETYTIGFSNGKSVQFTLTSNIIYYNNFNETYMWVEGSDGQNKESCQDYTMVKILQDEGGESYLQYTPSKATLNHAVNGADNRCFTFSVQGKNSWWWKWAFPSSGKVFIFFDYEIVEATEQTYCFAWFNASGTRTDVKLDLNANTYYVELDVADLQAFAIGCTAIGSASEGTYMNITEFGFGVVQAE